MLSRRLLLASALSTLVTPALAQGPDPATIVKSIYAKRDRYGAAASLQAARTDARPALSKSFAALWKRSDDATPEGDETPPGFDVASNSQGMDVTSAAVSVERRTATRATVVARLTAGAPFLRHSPAENVVRYDFVREHGAWKIDDVRGTIDPKPWSLRAIFLEVLKS
jgi:hypothetical protein